MGGFEDELLSVPEVAKRLGGISKWTVYAWLSQGRLRRTKVGARTMIRESELLRILRDGAEPKASSASEFNAKHRASARSRSGDCRE
jgi:excisionase family DNA binding protein